MVGWCSMGTFNDPCASYSRFLCKHLLPPEAPPKKKPGRFWFPSFQVSLGPFHLLLQEAWDFWCLKPMGNPQKLGGKNSTFSMVENSMQKKSLFFFLRFEWRLNPGMSVTHFQNSWINMGVSEDGQWKTLQMALFIGKIMTNHHTLR